MPGRLRTMHIRLLGLEDAAGLRPLVGTLTHVVDGLTPTLIMFKGEPFLLWARQGGDGAALYAQEIPLRIDSGMLEVRG